MSNFPPPKRNTTCHPLDTQKLLQKGYDQNETKWWWRRNQTISSSEKWLIKMCKIRWPNNATNKPSVTTMLHHLWVRVLQRQTTETWKEELNMETVPQSEDNRLRGHWLRAVGPSIPKVLRTRTAHERSTVAVTKVQQSRAWKTGSFRTGQVQGGDGAFPAHPYTQTGYRDGLSHFEEQMVILPTVICSWLMQTTEVGSQSKQMETGPYCSTKIGMKEIGLKTNMSSHNQCATRRHKKTWDKEKKGLWQ